MTDYADLVKRLRERIGRISQPGSIPISDLISEAADAIERLVKERDELRTANTGQMDRTQFIAFHSDLAERYQKGFRDGAEKMREKAASVCHEYETRMLTAAHERKNAGKPYSVAECKSDAGASLKEIIRALTTEDLT